MQKMRYNDSELRVIKSLFSENDEMLVALRKKMLDFPLSQVEANLVTYTPEQLAVISKTFNPEIEPEAPVNQIIDLWMTVDVKDKTPSEAALLLEARSRLIKYLTERLENKKPTITFESLSYSSKKMDQENLINQITRTTLLSHVEQQLNQLNFLAGQKDETVEQLMDRLQKDSSK